MLYEIAISFFLLSFLPTIQASGNSVSVEFPQATRSSSDNAYVINVTSTSSTGMKIEELNSLKFVDNSNMAREITPVCYDYSANADGIPVDISVHEFSIGNHKVICQVTTTGSSPIIKAVQLDIIVNPVVGTMDPIVSEGDKVCPAGQHLENANCVQDSSSKSSSINQFFVFLLVGVIAAAAIGVVLYSKYKRRPTKSGSDIIDVR